MLIICFDPCLSFVSGSPIIQFLPLGSDRATETSKAAHKADPRGNEIKDSPLFLRNARTCASAFDVWSASRVGLYRLHAAAAAAVEEDDDDVTRCQYKHVKKGGRENSARVISKPPQRKPKPN